MPLTKPPPPPPKPTFDEFSTPEDFNDQFKKKETTKYMNPCAVEEKQSMKCLDVNNYDKSKCEYFFLQYRECKKNWIRYDEDEDEDDEDDNEDESTTAFYRSFCGHCTAEHYHLFTYSSFSTTADTFSTAGLLSLSPTL